MAKTRRDLFYAIAAKIGGERGRLMRDAIKNCTGSGMMDREMTDEEFEVWLNRADRDLPKIMASLEDLGPENPGTWGFPN